MLSDRVNTQQQSIEIKDGVSNKRKRDNCGDDCDQDRPSAQQPSTTMYQNASSNSWDTKSVLVRNGNLTMIEDKCITITKEPLKNGYYCVETRNEMTQGMHGISLVLRGNVCTNDQPAFYIGVVKMQDEMNRYHYIMRGSNGRFMNNFGRIGGHLGNSIGDHKHDGEIAEGQTVSMEVDLDKGTLRFMVDGKLWEEFSGVTNGSFRWAVCMRYMGSEVEIVPTGLDTI